MERKLLTACSSVPKRHTWSEETLTGFFYNNKWFPQYCTIPEKMNIRKCLKDKRLILFGDSTIRHWYKHLMEDFACVAVTEYWTKEKWHKRSSCEIKRMNFTMEWIPHAQPFHVGLKWDTKRYTTHSIASQIDGLANNANVIVVIHMFSHVSAYHHSVFRDRMRIISKSVHRFLRRNKNAHIFIKSPHTHKHIGSFFGYVYRDIIQEEFKDLQDDIVYLNQADMTIAKINVDVHPPMDIVAAAVKQMLGFVCV